MAVFCEIKPIFAVGPTNESENVKVKPDISEKKCLLLA